MAIPKVKITFDADLDGLRKGVNGASNEVQGFGDRVAKFGKMAGAAFAAAGVAAAAYAGKLLVDGVKSAIADEAAQAKLATTLENVTGATNAQIAAVESQITKTSLLTGLTDDELRPSFERFVRATKDADQALKLQAVAIDVAAGSGKSLEAVTNAMSKAAEGNAGSLAKLGVGLTAAQLKTMSMEEITAQLAATFGGQASQQADTFQGKMQRLQVAFDEGKESVGSFVLDAITPMVSGFVNSVIPAVQKLAEELGPKLTPIFIALRDYIQNYVIPTFTAIWSFITEYVIPAIGSVLTPIIDGLRSAFEKVTAKIAENESKLKPLKALLEVIAKVIRDVVAPVIGTILGRAFDTLGTAISFVIGLFSNLVNVVNSAFNAIKNIVNFIKNNPVTQAVGGAIDNIFGGGRANGGPVSRGTSYVVGERGPELFVPNTSGKIIPNGGYGGRGNTINLTVNGAIDAEGTARTIIDVLNRSTSRGTLGAGQFSYS
jgi:phage-related protein